MCAILYVQQNSHLNLSKLIALEGSWGLAVHLLQEWCMYYGNPPPSLQKREKLLKWVRVYRYIYILYRKNSLHAEILSDKHYICNAYSSLLVSVFPESIVNKKKYILFLNFTIQKNNNSVLNKLWNDFISLILE